MEYTVNKLGRLAGISTRTLRYYDEIGILKPRKTNSSGYRIYGRNEVDQLQQILFYRELGLSLEEIKEIITKPTFDKQKALLEHHKTLLEKRNRLDLLIKNVETTIESIERGIPMTDQEKFEGFKRKMIEDNEGKYGTEIRNKYGEDAVNRSNKKVLNMTKEQHEEVTKLANEIKETLSAAYVTGTPASELAQKAIDLHRQWLCFFWDSYSKEAHAGLGQMYVDDERFRAYYDQNKPGTAQFLRDAILVYTGFDKKEL